MAGARDDRALAERRDRIARRASLSRATGQAGDYSRDFRSVYSLAGHSFLPGTFAAARCNAKIAESADVFLTIAARGAAIIRCQHSRTPVHIRPPMSDNFRVMLVPNGSIVHSVIAKSCCDEQSKRTINKLAESHNK